MTQDELVKKMQLAFEELCKDNTPKAFVAITVDKDMMVNYASYGVETAGTIDLLEHMIEYIKSNQESEDDFGRDENTTIH